MLRQVWVEGFKSFRSRQRMPLAPLTVLIGPNASGKTNFLEAVELLGWLARSHRLSDLAHVLRVGPLQIRGGIHDLGGDGSDFKLGASVDDDLELSVHFRIGASGLRIVGEQLEQRGEQVPLYQIQSSDEASETVLVEYNNFKRGGNKPSIACTDQQGVFTQLLTPARFAAKDTESQDRIPRAALRVAKALDDWLLLDPEPRSMRGYAYREETTLARNGANLSAIVEQLCHDEKSDLLGFVRELPEQDIADIGFLMTPRNEVMLELSETFGGTPVKRPAALLSDGTLRVLSVAASVLSARKGSTVVVEEIDNGVHPSRAQKLMDRLHEAARRRGVHVVMTTHNPALLDATPEDALGDVVACYRDPATGESRLQRLSDLDDFVSLEAQGPLGFLATSGTLERFLKQRRSANERERDRHETLDLFRRSGT